MERWPALEAKFVLMDFLLPDGSGAEAAAAVRAERPDTVVLFLSADESEESLLAAVEAGASGYLLKKSGVATDLRSAVRLAAARLGTQATATVADSLPLGLTVVGLGTTGGRIT